MSEKQAEYIIDVGEMIEPFPSYVIEKHPVIPVENRVAELRVMAGNLIRQKETLERELEKFAPKIVKGHIIDALLNMQPETRFIYAVEIGGQMLAASVYKLLFQKLDKELEDVLQEIKTLQE